MKKTDRIQALKKLLANPPDTEEEYVEKLLDYAEDPVVMMGPAFGPNKGRPHLVLCDLADNWGILYACPISHSLNFSNELSQRIRKLMKARRDRFQ